MKFQNLTAALAALGLFAAPSLALAEQGGSAGMDEIAASIDEESGDPTSAREWMSEYEERTAKHGETLAEHEKRLNALEEQMRKQNSPN